MFIRRKRNAQELLLEDIQKLQQKNNKIILLDVRSPQEYRERHLNGAINIPLYEISENIKRKLDINETIVVYCSSGIRSVKAIKILKKLGYTNLYNVKNGIE